MFSNTNFRSSFHDIMLPAFSQSEIENQLITIQNFDEFISAADSQEAWTTYSLNEKFQFFFPGINGKLEDTSSSSFVSSKEDMISSTNSIEFYDKEGSENSSSLEEVKDTLEFLEPLTYTGIPLNKEKEKDRVKQDTINKVFLRMIRRFYHKLFLQENLKMSRKRFVNIDYDKQLSAYQELIQKYLKADNGLELSYFLIKLCNLRAKNSPDNMNDAELNGAEIGKLTKSFSRVKFAELHKNKLFRQLFHFIYHGTIENGSKRCIDVLFDQESYNITKHNKKYTRAFARMNYLCQQQE
ncbi:unnamed protein product [Moneuplotes crassus]|uniref:Uncharacterized protein n=1 Tax=Euplotes crassus TaxID=5936 RepID=A0AAD1XJ82_EUPCR|nr:unnamed protein product [Moneuplotes crassus]